MKPITFDAKIIWPEGTGTWCFVNLPPEFSTTCGKKGQVRVKGTVNSIQYQSTALPTGDSGHYLVVGSPKNNLLIP